MAYSGAPTSPSRLLYAAYVRLPTEKAHGAQIMRMCEALAEHLSVELVIPGRESTIAEDPFSYYHIEPSYALALLPVPDLVSCGRVGFLVSSFLFAVRVARRARREKLNIIYSRDKIVLLTLSFIPLPHVRLMWEVHGKESPWIVRRLAATCSIVAISTALKKELIAAGATQEKVLVAPDAVAYETFALEVSRSEARQKLGLSPEGRIALYAGHLYPRKGAQTLADAARFFPDNVRAVFVGGTDEDVMEFRKRFSTRQRIDVLGHKPPGDIPFYLRAADVLVLPNSARDENAARYTSPMKLFEYMASGIPIVASDVPALREILSEHEALFVPADDPVALGAAVARALENQEESSRRARAAQEAAKTHTWKARAEKIVAFALI